MYSFAERVFSSLKHIMNLKRLFLSSSNKIGTFYLQTEDIPTQPFPNCIPWNTSHIISVQFSHSVMSGCDPMDCSTPGFPVHHQHPELAQTHVCWVSDAIQTSHPLSSPSPPTVNLSQHQGPFKRVSSHQVAKVLEFQLQHQSLQWIFRTDFL